MRSLVSQHRYWPTWVTLVENFREQTYRIRITHGEATFEFTTQAWLRADEYFDMFMMHKNRMIREAKKAEEVAAVLMQ